MQHRILPHGTSLIETKISLGLHTGLNHKAALRKQACAGMTLVEVMMAFSLFAIMALGALVALVQTRKMSENNVAQATAAVIAQGIIEQLQLDSYTDVATGPSLPLKFINTDSTNLAIVQNFNLAWATDTTTFTDIGAVDTTDPSLPVLGVLLDLDYMNGTNVVRRKAYMKMRVNLRRNVHTTDDNVELILTYSWQPPSGNGASDARYLTREIRTIRSTTPSY